MQVVKASVRAVVAAACALFMTACDGDVEGFRARLKCGMTRQEITKVAAEYGCGECGEPTERWARRISGVLVEVSGSHSGFETAN